jgi:phosphonate transport system permease protein
LATTATIGPAEGVVARFEAHRSQLLAQRRWRMILFWVVLVGLLAVSANFAQVLPGRLAEGLPKVADYIVTILPKLDFPVLLEGTKTEGSLAYWYFNLPKYLRLLVETVNMALIATCVGTTAAVLLSFPAARNLVRGAAPYWFARRVTEFCRGVPDVVFAILFVYAFGVGPLAGVIAITIHTAGALGKLFAEVNENASLGPVEGVRAAGGSWAQEMRFGVLPQVLPNFLSYALLRFEINIRTSAVIGFVGAGGIGQELYYVISFNFYEEVSALAFLIVLTVVLIDLLSSRLRGAVIGQERLL